MKSSEDRWGQLLLIVVMGLSLFILGCFYKEVTTEVRTDGSGRNVFLIVAPRSDGSEDTEETELDMEEARPAIEECGAQVLPYADDQYEGLQAIFAFQTFSEIPGQISCFMEDVTNLRIDGQYEEGRTKRTYRLETRIKPFALWSLSQNDPMLYRVIMPGRIVAYSNLQTTEVRTVRDASNQVSWYFSSPASPADDAYDASLEYTLTVRAEQSLVPVSDWLGYGAIFLLAAVLIVALGILLWQVVNASARPRRASGHASGREGQARAAKPHEPRPSTPPSHYPAAGTILDRYQIRDELGRGGMAAVYRARHHTLQRDVALKILAPWLTTTSDFVTRFRQEGHILARLDHPHIVAVHDAGSAQGYYYLAMELVRGRSLDQALKRQGRFEPRHAVAIAQQVAQALDYAHQKGIIHRDIKPANILLNEKGQVKVADFGIVAILGENQVADTRIGTPRYMAYEQFTGEATLQSDLYSLGACLYEMLTGQCPPAFGLETPAPPSHFNRAISPALDHAVLKCLRSDARRRHASARQLIDVLQRVR